ncbi:MAG TPA: ATP-binding protein [Flavobacterium sp.]|nr:ATP-binding protein [Flavobacterium sp.]
MKSLRLYKHAQVFKIALGIAIIVIGYIASVFYSKMQKLDDSVELIATSNQTQLELEKLLSIISNYETSLRSYIITKDESYLKDRFLNRGEIELNIRKLKKLTSHSPEVTKDLDSLKVMFNRRFDLFRETLTIAKAKNIDKNELNTKLLESTAYTNRMREAVYRRINSEAKKLRDLNNTHQFELEDSIISAFLLVILSLLILLLSFNKVNVDIDELKKANDELQFLNLSFNNAEKIAGFGHWKVNLETNTYTFSDNYYRLLGVEPHAFEPNLENATKYIHPDDLEYVMQTHQDSLVNHESTSIVSRFLPENGETKYFRIVGSFTHNSKGQLVKVGVNYDITDLYKKTVELEENNKELQAINDELESFNNIVSHDLQEPLRKIQMFISRLEDDDGGGLSDQGKDYFTKIRTAANRMQTLMMDLVNYTRTIKGDKTFVKTNLNSLLDQILLDLALNIEEKNASVTIGNLPTIQTIPFQIEQLFINLITNSLKYSKEDVAPEISITAEKITEKETYQDIDLTDKKYHKIVVSDNGIGFRQEYAEKIFVLFQRLETDAKYSGTGLGLAICKKIVENHNGCIKVRSKPNVGTQFSIYFPKNA